MIKHIALLGFVAIAVSACAAERRTEVIVAPQAVVTTQDACARYGFTASTADYFRCQDQLAAQRRLGRVVVMDNASVMASSQAACDSYGVPRGTANYDVCVRDEFAARRPG